MRSRTLVKSGRWWSFGKLLHICAVVILTISLSLLAAGGQNMNSIPLPQGNNNEQCIRNLQEIYKLLKYYVHGSGGALGFPSNLESVYGMSKDPSMFVCPADKQATPKSTAFQTSYKIVNNPLKSNLSKKPASQVAIVAEKRPNHDGRRFVLFYDGSVRAFDDSQFETLRRNSFIDKETAEEKH
jgi:hypothetical protein